MHTLSGSSVLRAVVCVLLRACVSCRVSRSLEIQKNIPGSEYLFSSIGLQVGGSLDLFIHRDFKYCFIYSKQV